MNVVPPRGRAVRPRHDSKQGACGEDVPGARSCSVGPPGASLSELRELGTRCAPRGAIEWAAMAPSADDGGQVVSWTWRKECRCTLPASAVAAFCSSARVARVAMTCARARRLAFATR